MFDKERFRLEFEATGLKKRFVSDKLGMAYDHFVKLTNGERDWKAREITAICKLLKWNNKTRDAIFFASEVSIMLSV